MLFLKKIYAIPLFILILSGLRIIIPELPGYELSTDEGINVMKSALSMHGFSLYDQIWSDQPPLFTHVQAWWFSIFGSGLAQGRSLVLLFSSVLTWLLCQIVTMERRLFSGCCAVVFLLCSGDFLLCSMKIMIGIPALALALLSVYFFYIYRFFGGNKYFLLLSAFVLALSAATKLFTIILLPAFTVEIIRGRWLDNSTENNNFKNMTGLLVSWWGVFLAGIVIVFYFSAPNLYPKYIDQIILPHARLMEKAEGLQWQEIHELAQIDYDYLALALLGVIVMVMRRKFSFIFPLTWLVSSIIFLLHHNPIWHHHYLLISLPLVWLATLAVGEIDLRPLWHFLVGRGKLAVPSRSLVEPCIFCLILMAMAYHLPAKFERLRDRFPDYQSEINQNIVGTMLKYQSQTNWVVTDRPVYPFVGQLLVPPELAVFSLKRFNSGFLDAKDIKRVIERYRPEQILFGRFGRIRREVGAHLQKEYRNVISENGLTLFVRKDVVKPSHAR